MLIRDIGNTGVGGRRRSTALIEWENNDYLAQRISFEINDLSGCRGEDGNHFLTAAFPLAVLHREKRLRVDAPVCPMLIDGLHTVHAWWAKWGGLPRQVPKIESSGRYLICDLVAPKRAISFLSGGVDSLHLLLRNRQLYQAHDPAYVRDAVFVHGFDIGKRPRVPGTELATRVQSSLQPVADEAGVRLLRGYTDLRHLPSAPGFWAYRYAGAGAAAFGHFAAPGAAFVFMAGHNSVRSLYPLGLHPAIDPNYSSQRVSILHDGICFSRLDKVRELTRWPAALEALRVCPADAGDRLNCGVCGKCLCTRLELLAAGCDYCGAFGETRMSPELLAEVVHIQLPYLAAWHHELLEPLRQRGFDSLSNAIERKLEEFKQRPPISFSWTTDQAR